MVQINKSYKVRLYPSKEQERLFYKHIYACRFIWNYMLDIQNKRWERGEKRLSAFDMNRLLTPLKKQPEYSWLNECSNGSYQSICADLNRAYQLFFEKAVAHPPRFKHGKMRKLSYPVASDLFYFKDENYAVIPRVGNVKYKTDFRFAYGRLAAKYYNVRIKLVNKKWMLIVGMESEANINTISGYSMGIDLGVKELAVVEYGGKMLVFHNINKGKEMRRLDDEESRIRKGLSRKYNTNKKNGCYTKTQNILREEEKLRRVCARKSNIRTNYIHQITHRLVSMHPCRVVMEDLSVTQMVQDRRFSSSISEQCFFEFIRQMRYKCEREGIEFVLADRFFPSSKMCSACGYINKDLKLKDRIYVCPECGNVVDRDYNAAINLSRYKP